MQAVRFTDLGKSGEQLLGGSDSPSHFWNGWSKGMRGQGTKEAQLPPFSSQGTTGEQEEGKEKLLAINQQQREKEGNTTISPPVHRPLKGEGNCQTNSALGRFANL